jgi:uncharacterized membrane protein HdeD (DUF308 family)
MTMSLDAAAQVMREAMRETIRRHSLWYLIQSALMILAGILALVYPVVSSVGLVFLLGWLLIISGVVQSISLVDVRNVPHFWLQLVSVVLSVIVGVLLLRHPGQGLLTLTLLLIVFFIVEGISKVIFSLTVRPFPNWGWVLASGIVGILLAFYLWAPNNRGLAAWRIARHTAHLRRGRSRLSSLEGAYELRLGGGNRGNRFDRCRNHQARLVPPAFCRDGSPPAPSRRGPAAR